MKNNYFEPATNGGVARESTPGRREEKRLLAAAQDGDPAALRALLRQVSEPAFRFGMNFCRDRQDAEEIAQDVLAALARSLGRYRGEASLTTWAYAVARNACIRRRRRARPGEESLDAWREERGGDLADPDGGPEAQFERGEIRSAVEAGLRALPADLREAVVLRDVEGLSTHDAAGVLRLTERAFKSRLHRGRLRLRAWLEPTFRPDASAPDGRTRPDAASRRCPDIARYLSLHEEGDVDAALCARLAAHVRDCPSCAATCRSVRTTLRACRSLGRRPLPRSARTALRGAIPQARKRMTARS